MRILRRPLVIAAALTLVLTTVAPAQAAVPDVWAKWSLGDHWIRSLDYVGSDIIAGSEGPAPVRSGAGQAFVPIATGDAFADGLTSAGGGTTNKLTFPPGDMSAPSTLVAEIGGVNVLGYDFSPDGSTLYGVDDSSDSLITVNQSTGAMTTVGPMAVNMGDTWTDLTIDPVSGAAYAMSVEDTATTIYTVDLATGATAEINTTGGPAVGVDMSINCQGEAYALIAAAGLPEAGLTSVNLAVGSFGSVSLIGLAVETPMGVDFDNETGILHAWLNLVSSDNTQYSSIDLASGAATAFPGGTIAGVFEGAIKNTCVEPTATIVSGPTGNTASTRPDFGFLPSAGTVACSMDRGTPAFGACTTSTSFRPAAKLAKGRWTFRVRATEGGQTVVDTQTFSVVDCIGLAVGVEKAKAKKKAAEIKLVAAITAGDARKIAKAENAVRKAKKAVKKAKAALKAHGVC